MTNKPMGCFRVSSATMTVTVSKSFLTQEPIAKCSNFPVLK